MSLKELWTYLLLNHRGKTIGGLAGICFGLFIVVLGWKFFILLFFALIGLIIGKSIDDNTDPREVLRRLFGD